MSLQELTYEQQLAYVAAFMDAEGYIVCKLGRTDKLLRRVGFTNTDKHLFEYVCGILENAGLSLYKSCRKGQSMRHSSRYDAHIRGGKEAFRRFAEVFPLQHRGKVDKLRSMLADYAQTEAAGRQRRHYRSSRWTHASQEERVAHGQMMRAAQRAGGGQESADAT